MKDPGAGCEFRNQGAYLKPGKRCAQKESIRDVVHNYVQITEETVGIPLFLTDYIQVTFAALYLGITGSVVSRIIPSRVPTCRGRNTCKRDERRGSEAK